MAAHKPLLTITQSQIEIFDLFLRCSYLYWVKFKVKRQTVNSYEKFDVSKVGSLCCQFCTLQNIARKRLAIAHVKTLCWNKTEFEILALRVDF